MIKDIDFDEYLQKHPFILNGAYYKTEFDFKNAIINKLIFFNLDNSGINPSFRYIEPHDVFIEKLKDSSLILNCHFKDDVILNIQNLKTKITFIDCEFEKRLIIVFNNSEIEQNNQILFGKCKINDLLIEGNCANIFSIYHSTINSLKIENTIFKNIFEFISVTIFEELEIENTFFKKTTLFDNCKFFKFPKLKYNIFEAFTYFRNSEFKLGLILDYCSFEKDINFYGVKGLDSKISKQNTSQETYRIIKNQFEKLNNKIEANKYHALEMEQHRNNIWKNMFNCNSFFKLLPDGIVLLVHKLSSNHSNNWFLALFWIFVVSLITSWSLDSVTVDNIFKYINILSKIEDFKNSYIAMTLNKVSLGYLYYQFLTAVRKDTRK